MEKKHKESVPFDVLSLQQSEICSLSGRVKWQSILTLCVGEG